MDASMKKKVSYQQGSPHTHVTTSSGLRPDSIQETSSASGSASGTSEDSLNLKLSKLLKMKSEEFYEAVILDEFLESSLSTYLKKKRQPANFHNEDRMPITRVFVGDEELYRRVFMVFYRMSLIFERGTINGVSAEKQPADIMYTKKVFDISKLLDICVIYGHENRVLTKRLVNNALISMKQLRSDLANLVASHSEKIHGIHQLCFSTLMVHEQIPRVQDKLIKMFNYVTDVLISIHALVDAYPEVAKILVHQSEAKYQIFRIFAAMHDSLLPTVQKTLDHFGGIIAENQINFLRRFRFKTIEVVWRLLYMSYLSDIDALNGNGMGVSQNTVYNPLTRGEEFLQAMVSMVEGPSDFVLMEEHLHHGALLRNIEKKHKLLDRVKDLRKKGLIDLDSAQYDYVEGIIGHAFATMGSEVPNRSVSVLKTPQIPEDDILYESKITHIKDLLPEYGRGFIAACLEAYNDDPEEVIQRILEGTLHPSLESLNITLEKKPEIIAPSLSSKDKGKGKIDETILQSSQNILSSNGGIHDMKAPSMLAKDKGKGRIDDTLVHSSANGSSSKVGLRDANVSYQRKNSSMSASSSSVHDSGINSLSKPPSYEHVKRLEGRFVRKSKGDENAIDLLDVHDEKDVLRTVSYATQYEDEYDDSFDDLNTHIADGIEETEVLADRVKLRLLEDPNGSRNNWVNNHARNYHQKGTSVLANSSGESELMQKTQMQMQMGIGRGGGGGRGRGRGRIQKPKSQYFVKDGKNYSYKVAGSVAVANVGEAEALARADDETIRGVNLPILDSEMTSTQLKNLSNQTDANSMHGSLPNGRGRGGPRRGYDQHHRKDRAMKKHFSSIGGL